MPGIVFSRDVERVRLSPREGGFWLALEGMDERNRTFLLERMRKLAGCSVTAYLERHGDEAGFALFARAADMDNRSRSKPIKARRKA